MIHQSLVEATERLAGELARQLGIRSIKIVFAESCTAGLVSALLAQVPGISKWLCGSAVTYQEETKQSWLQVDSEMLSKHSAVSSQVTEAMARNALINTPHAELAVAVTGHLEPTYNQEATDGKLESIAYVVVGFRRNQQIVLGCPTRLVLHEGTRVNRQWEAACRVLEIAVQAAHFPTAMEPDKFSACRDQ